MVSNNKLSPLQAIEEVFSATRPALMPYYTLGYPDLERSLEVIEACVQGGADLMELGVPFSDPLADGPTIQKSSQVALEGGISVRKCIQSVEELRRRGIQIPFVMMSYANPILAYGVNAFVKDCQSSGVNGLIIPDLPIEEALDLSQRCQEAGLALIYLLAPNSSTERIEKIAARSTGFAYLVSVKGITGARDQLPPDLIPFIQRVHEVATTPLAVGFGISTPHQAAQVGAVAQGVIVGSALINQVDLALSQGQSPTKAARQYIQQLKHALAN